MSEVLFQLRGRLLSGSVVDPGRDMTSDVEGLRAKIVMSYELEDWSMGYWEPMKNDQDQEIYKN